jgi:hypothetical protein
VTPLFQVALEEKEQSFSEPSLVCHRLLNHVGDVNLGIHDFT